MADLPRPGWLPTHQASRTTHERSPRLPPLTDWSFSQLCSLAQVCLSSVNETTTPGARLSS
jgi:hypothetical protein